MSDQDPKPRIKDPDATTECAVCGHVPGPFPECSTCHGSAKTQSRAYTRTEEQQGASSDPDRYKGGNVNVEVVSLPGSDPRFGGRPFGTSKH